MLAAQDGRSPGGSQLFETHAAIPITAMGSRDYE
jgi:hypothetical protein